MCVLTGEVVHILHNIPCKRYLRIEIARKKVFRPLLGWSTSQARLKYMINTSTAPNTIWYDQIERCTARKLTRAEGLQTPSKTNTRQYTTAKVKLLAVWKWCQSKKWCRPCRCLYTTEFWILPPQKHFLRLAACVAQHPTAFTSRCRACKEGRGALKPPPEDVYVFQSFNPCWRQANQTNAQAQQ